MSWSSKNPELLSCFRTFIDDYSKEPSALFCFLQSKDCLKYLNTFPEDEEPQQRASLVLLAGALNQGIRPERLFQFIQLLINHYGKSLFALPAVSQANLCRDVQEFTHTAYWDIRDQVPGIIWSIGEFVRTYNISKLIEQKSYNEVISLLSGELFYMGATSESKYKAKRLYNWLVLPYPVGLGLAPNVNGDDLEITITESAHRFMRDAGPLKGSAKAFPTTEHRIRYYKSFYSFLSPRFPQLIEHVFYFLNDNKMNEFIQLAGNDVENKN